jgi:hypothetical protein
MRKVAYSAGCFWHGLPQVEAFLWVAAACAAVDILLVLFVQAAGERSLQVQAVAALA